MRVLSYVVPAEDDGQLIRRVARGRLGISSHQLARAKALGALCLDGESVVNRDVTIKLSDKKLNFFGPAGCSCNRTARPKGPELNNL